MSTTQVHHLDRVYVRSSVVAFLLYFFVLRHSFPPDSSSFYDGGQTVSSALPRWPGVSSVIAGCEGRPLQRKLRVPPRLAVFCSLALRLQTSVSGFLAHEMQMGSLPLGRENRIIGAQNLAPGKQPARCGPGKGTSRCDCPRVAERKEPSRKWRTGRILLERVRKNESHSGRGSRPRRGAWDWPCPSWSPPPAPRGPWGRSVSPEPLLNRKVPTGVS